MMPAAWRARHDHADQGRARHPYVYSKPLIASTQYLRSRRSPADSGGGKLEGLDLPGRRHPCNGRTIRQLLPHPHRRAARHRAAIRVSGLVRTRDTNGVVGLAPAELPPGLYLARRPTRCASPTIATMPKVRESAERNRIEAARVMIAIADDVDYTKGETHVHTSAAEALEQGSGVCQDHAHIFCAVCRALGVPARYVSGYLFRPRPRSPCIEPRLGRRLCRASWLGELRSLQPRLRDRGAISAPPWARLCGGRPNHEAYAAAAGLKP